MNKEDAVKEALDNLCSEAHYNGNTLTLVKSWRDTVESAIAANKAEVEPLLFALKQIRDYRKDVSKNIAADSMRFYAELALQDYATPPATTGGANATPTGANTVLTDERIEELYIDCSFTEASDAEIDFARAIEREVVAQAGRVAVPDVNVQIEAARNELVEKVKGFCQAEVDLHAPKSALNNGRQSDISFGRVSAAEQIYQKFEAAVLSPAKESK